MDGSDRRGPALQAEPFVRIRNGNPQAIYNAAIRVDVGVRGIYTREVGSVGPDETREHRIRISAWPRGFEPIPDLLFTDPAGRAWIRAGRTGDLKEPSDRERAAFYVQDPGAYDSIESHPTLNESISPEDSRGRMV